MAAFAGVPLYQVWTALHVPAVSLPAFTGPNGMPVGAQLVARRHADRKLFACARWAWRNLN
jgi:Asp-tRNA(Asn)/Glu-tRNA(Gln) amidotransferase A subunit family amidase